MPVEVRVSDGLKGGVFGRGQAKGTRGDGGQGMSFSHGTAACFDFSGQKEIVSELLEGGTHARGGQIARRRSPPRQVAEGPKSHEG